MKKLKWFQIGEEIPDDAKFIKSETYLDDVTKRFELERFLYEVPVTEKTTDEELKTRYEHKIIREIIVSAI